MGACRRHAKKKTYKVLLHPGTKPSSFVPLLYAAQTPDIVPGSFTMYLESASDKGDGIGSGARLCLPPFSNGRASLAETVLCISYNVTKASRPTDLMIWTLLYRPCDILPLFRCI